MQRLILALLWLLPFVATSQGVPLTDQAEVSIITLGPDQNELVQAFGHTAIRIYDPALGIDYAYNYGVFSFNQPNFYLNFARGHNYYYLGIAPYPDFRDVYIYYHRSVHEQVLNLTQSQKQKVFDLLQINARPENREYLYDYFFNNCATKVRDLFTAVLKEEIRFDSSYIKTDRTFRQLMNSYLGPLPWGHVGLNIGLGSPIDRKAYPSEYMYLPDYIESAFDHATLTQNGNTIALVKSKIIVFDPKPEKPESGFVHPWITFGLLLLVAAALSVWDLKRKRPSLWFDALLLLSSGTIGLVLLLLWTATDHHACVWNYNLLWALPTHLIAVVFLVKKNKPNWVRNYFLVTACISAIVLLAWNFLPQQLSPFLTLVVVALLIRSVTLFRLLPMGK